MGRIYAGPDVDHAEMSRSSVLRQAGQPTRSPVTPLGKATLMLYPSGARRQPDSIRGRLLRLLTAGTTWLFVVEVVEVEASGPAWIDRLAGRM